VSDQLELTASPLAAFSDVELASEMILDATMVLSMGETGIAPAVAAALRAGRLAALHELLERWEPR